MKKSKLLIGASVVLLAVASAFTTKPANKFLTGFTKDSLGSGCTSSYTTDCSGTASNCLTSLGNKTLFTTNACSTPIKKNP